MQRTSIEFGIEKMEKVVLKVNIRRHSESLQTLELQVILSYFKHILEIWVDLWLADRKMRKHKQNDKNFTKTWLTNSLSPWKSLTIFETIFSFQKICHIKSLTETLETTLQ